MLTRKYKMTQHAGHRLVTGPASEPVTLAEVRELLRNPPTAENAMITLCITQARQMFEAATGIACINQSWKITLNTWPNYDDEWWDGVRELPVTYLNKGGPNYVTMPRYPLSSITSVTTYGMDRSTTALTVDNYFFADTVSFPGRMVLKDTATWPTLLTNTNAVDIIYVAGFGADADAVPGTIKRAIQSLAVFLWKNRGDGCSPQDAISGSGALQIAGEYVRLRL